MAINPPVVIVATLVCVDGYGERFEVGKLWEMSTNGYGVRRIGMHEFNGDAVNRLLRIAKPKLIANINGKDIDMEIRSVGIVGYTAGPDGQLLTLEAHPYRPSLVCDCVES